MLATQSLPLPAPVGLRVYSARRPVQGHAGRARFDASGLDRVLRHDPERGLLEVQSGTPWRALAAHGGSAFGPGTVGESVAANAARPRRPPDGRAPALADPGHGRRRAAARQPRPRAGAVPAGGGRIRRVRPLLQRDARPRVAGAGRRARGGTGAPRVARGARHRAARGTASTCWCRRRRARRSSPRRAPRWSERRCRLARLEVRHTLPEEETFLRWARREYAALRIEYRSRSTLGGCVSATAAAHAAGRTGPGGGRQHRAAPACRRQAAQQAAACYPMLGAFLAEKRRYDPGRARVERLVPRHARPLRREPCAARWSRD